MTKKKENLTDSEPMELCPMLPEVKLGGLLSERYFKKQLLSIWTEEKVRLYGKICRLEEQKKFQEYNVFVNNQLHLIAFEESLL